MRIRTIKESLYTFNELSEEAKEKAIENLYDVNVDYAWWDSTYENAENIGCKITGFDIDRGSYCNIEFQTSAIEVAEDILINHGEQSETYKTAMAFMQEWQPISDDYMDEASENYESAESEDKLCELEEDFKNSLSEDYRIILKNEYEYLTSKEAIIKSIEVNGYEFYEDGTMA